MQRVSTRPRKTSSSEPCGVSKHCAPRWPSASRPLGSGGSLSSRIRASARISVAGRPEQGMAALDAAQQHAVEIARRLLDQLRIDELEAGGVGAHAGLAGPERHRHRVEAEDLRPFLGDDVDQMIEPLGVDRGEHGGVDRMDRARMAAREGDEVLIGLLRRRHARPQVRERMRPRS